ncbi:hypothetical protein LRD17_02240 [Halorhodospira halochloris]|nr:hypothetical protein [Halorhodospira halochloris]
MTGAHRNLSSAHVLDEGGERRRSDRSGLQGLRGGVGGWCSVLALSLAISLLPACLDDNGNDNDNNDNGAENGDDGSGGNGDDGNGVSDPESSGLTIHPDEPVVADSDGAHIDLVAELRENGEIVNPAEEEDVEYEIEWSVVDGDSHEVNEDTGRLEAVRGTGTSTIEAQVRAYDATEEEADADEGAGDAVVIASQLQEEGDDLLDEWTATVEARATSLDMDNIVINPRLATLPPEGRQEFHVAGISDGSPAHLEKDDVRFDCDEQYLDCSVNDRDGDMTLELEAQGNRGYTYVVPRYEQDGISITGTPVVVEIEASMEAPPTAAEGGNHLLLDLQGGDFFITHGSDDTVHFERWISGESRWGGQDPGSANVDALGMVVDEGGDTLHLAWAEGPTVYTKAGYDQGASWGGTNTLGEESADIEGNHHLATAVHDGDGYLLYRGDDQESLVLYDIGDEEPHRFETKEEITALDLTLDRDGSLRFAYSTEDDGLYFGGRDDGEFYNYQVRDDYQAERVALSFSLGNIPHVAAYNENGAQFDLFFWYGEHQDWVSSIFDADRLARMAGVREEDAMHGNLRSLELAFDQYDSPTVAFTDDDSEHGGTVGGLAYYLKLEDGGTDQEGDWRVEIVEMEGVGDALSMDIGDDNRMRMAYAFDEERPQGDTHWWEEDDVEETTFRFWQEPTFFEYRRREARMPGSEFDLTESGDCLTCEDEGEETE